MDADIKLWSRTCLPCQRSKTSERNGEPNSEPPAEMSVQTFKRRRAEKCLYELTLGTELRLPGEFFLDSTSNTTDPTSFVEIIKAQIQDDTVRRPLQQPYTEPHKVLRRIGTSVTLVANGKTLTRHSKTNQTSTTQKHPNRCPGPTTRTRRSRRPTKPPVRFRDYVPA
ncbi:hypothetical protein MTP99_003026 [Tenebrio molitor]|nr:hypothetical protein MTP99_003026 [Tenebrio molitor]